MTARYALYYVPADDSALGRFGARLFGRWPDNRVETDTFDIPDRSRRIHRVARYGFHATLKAPFQLASGCTEEGLVRAVEEGVRDWRPVSLSGLRVTVDAQTLSLSRSATLVSDPHDPVCQLASRCVQEFEHWRAPLDEASRQRRKPESLSAHERKLLDTFGYPWVLDAFRFHITLADRRHTSADETLAQTLDERFSTMVTATPMLDRIAVCHESAPHEPLVQIATFALVGTAL